MCQWLTKANGCQRLASPKDILWMACYNILIRCKLNPGGLDLHPSVSLTTLWTVYTNSFLAALNMRPYFRGDNSHSAPETLMLSPCRPGNSGNVRLCFGDLEPLKLLLTLRVQHLSVHVDQSVETKVDDSFGAQAISV
jgi:hypothetical protein